MSMKVGSVYSSSVSFNRQSNENKAVNNVKNNSILSSDSVQISRNNKSKVSFGKLSPAGQTITILATTTVAAGGSLIGHALNLLDPLVGAALIIVVPILTKLAIKLFKL